MDFNIFQSDNIILKVDKKGDIAYLEIENKERPISEEKLNTLIEKAGIIYGFKNAKEIRNPDDKPIVLAIADKYEKKDEIKYNIEIPTRENISLSNIADLPFVDKEDIIAEEAGNLSEIHAKNIFGNPVNDIANNSLSEIIGKGAIAGRTKIIAAISGYIYKDETGKINIMDEIITKGKIEQKNITLKIKLICENDVIKSRIESTEDVIIKGKISDASYIFSKKNVEISSVENSKIIAEKNIVFYGKAINSYLVADNKIFGKNGSTADLCNLKSGEKIHLYNARNKASLEICIAPTLKEKLIILDKNSKKAETLKNKIENKFYDFDQNGISPSIIVSNHLEKDIYLRVFDKSLLNKKTKQNFSFS